MISLSSSYTTRGALRQVDLQSIRAFVEDYKMLLEGTVLDYGAGLQPYKDLVKGRYIPYTLINSSTPAGSPVTEQLQRLPGTYDAILCTQVLQYIEYPEMVVAQFSRFLWEREGYLVLTYPTNWPEDEAVDIHRFTKAGMNSLLVQAGFRVIVHTCRGVIKFPDFEQAFGYGVIARMGDK